MLWADLHLHSNYSDGSWSPEELLKRVKEKRLDCISLVDHDCVDGIGSLIDLAKLNEIEIIPGVELTAEINGTEMHILGYLIDWQDSYLQSQLEKFKKIRLERIYQMCEKLKTVGININPEEVISSSGHGTVGRLHLAKMMQEKGYVSTTNEAFYKYISDQGPAYVGKSRLSPGEAIKLVLNVKGLPVLAHPYSLRKDELIIDLVKFGLKGIEVYYPEHTPSLIKKYENICQEHSLLMTGGSDCHGNSKDEVLIGKIKIPYKLVEKLKEAKSKMFG